MEILEQRPEINTTELLQELRAREGGPVIDEITDGEIYSKDGRNPVKISALKDRLSRARKKLSSR